jgi:hypothetical protein
MRLQQLVSSAEATGGLLDAARRRIFSLSRPFEN